MKMTVIRQLCVFIETFEIAHDKIALGLKDDFIP